MDEQICITGRIFKTARMSAEWYEFVEEPESFLDRLKQSGIRADVFTFVQKIPDLEPKYTNYHLERESISVLPIETYEKWWKSQIRDKTRNMVRKARKRGVEMRFSQLDDKFVSGVTAIYNECRIRQGKPFKHFGKDFETVRRENSSFSDRSDFIGAYYGEEIIGFAKLVNRGVSASLMQIISKVSHRDKAPTNALIAKAVERCAQLGISYLQYGVWSSGSIGEFKIHHGFKRFDMPRYYVPLNGRGRLMLTLGLHHRLHDRLPESTLNYLRAIRTKCYGLPYSFFKALKNCESP
jgi:hypothetical protein